MAKTFLEMLAGLPQTPKSFSRHLRGSRHSPRRLRRPRKYPGICRDVCAGCARLPAFTETFAQAAQVPRHLPRRLRRPREAPGICRDVCAGCARFPAFAETFAQAARGSRHSPRRLRGSRKRQKVFRDTCSVPANTKKFFAALAAFLQTPKSFSRDLRNSRKHQGKKRACGGSCFPVHALCSASTLWMDGAGYLAIFSSHFNIPSMTNMEMRQMVRKTVQHCQMGILLYISGPIQRKRLPMAVAPSQRP